MNVCRNCGFEYEGNFCPRCGTEAYARTESSDVVLSSYENNEAFTVAGMPSVGALSLEAREKNTLEHVERLLSCGGFDEAVDGLKDLEKEEIAHLGTVSAAVYYYKILARYRAVSGDELARRLAERGVGLVYDTDFRMIQSCPDDGYKAMVNGIEKNAEVLISEKRAAEVERKRAQETGRSRRAVRVSVVSACFAAAGLVLFFVGIASWSRFLILTSLIISVVCCFISLLVSVYVIRNWTMQKDRMRGLNVLLLVLSAVFIVLDIVFILIF